MPGVECDGGLNHKPSEKRLAIVDPTRTAEPARSSATGTGSLDASPWIEVGHGSPVTVLQDYMYPDVIGTLRPILKAYSARRNPFSQEAIGRTSFF